MSRDKQIEEMAKVIARRSTAFRNPNVAFMTTATKTAESLYNAGYRKVDSVTLMGGIVDHLRAEVAEEIFAEIEALIYSKCFSIRADRDVTGFIIDGEQFAELKKKYTESEKDNG